MNNYSDFGNSLRAQVIRQYGIKNIDKLLSAGDSLDHETMITDNKDIDNTVELMRRCSRMTQEQLDLFIHVVDLCEGRPDRQEFALSWKGKAKDLPAALAKI